MEESALTFARLIILLSVTLVPALLCLIMGLWGLLRKSDKPIGKYRKCDIADVRGFNRARSKLWLFAAGIYAFAPLLPSAIILPYFIIMFVIVFFGAFYIHKNYMVGQKVDTLV